jgi:co-chaperonin GroES (HSP10)
MISKLASACALAALLPTGCTAYSIPAANKITTAAAASSYSSTRVSALRLLAPTQDAIEPLNDQILVDLQSIPSQTEVGILLPTVFLDDDEDDAFLAPEPRAGTIVSVGPGRTAGDGTTIPMPDLKVGQKIVVGPAKGKRVKLDGQLESEATLFLFTPDEIWGPCSE